MLTFYYEMILAFFLRGSGQCGSRLKIDTQKINFENEKSTVLSLALGNHWVNL